MENTKHINEERGMFLGSKIDTTYVDDYGNNIDIFGEVVGIKDKGRKVKIDDGANPIWIDIETQTQVS